MSTYPVLVLVLMCVALPLKAEETFEKLPLRSPSSESGLTSSVKPLSPRKTSVMVIALLRKHARAEATSDRIAIALDIVGLAESISTDSRLSRSSLLRQSRKRLFARLRSIKEEVERQMRRDRRRAEKLSAMKTVGTKQPESIPEFDPADRLDDVVLAQLNQAVNQGPARNAGINLAQPADYGPQLVELIQRVISPNTWDVNGGPSTIQYWRPGMALVVRAPKDVHDEFSPLLLQMRKQ